mgnify:CR=1 FL=1
MKKIKIKLDNDEQEKFGMNDQEQAFFEWWDKVESHLDQINLRIAFDAGYQAAIRRQTNMEWTPKRSIANEDRTKI